MESLPFKYQRREYWEFYCPVCKGQRRSFYWPAPRTRHYLSLVVLALFLTAALRPWLGFKGGVLVLPIWAIFEFVYRARARQSLICTRCGFDPCLYKYDVRLARDKVARFWAEKLSAKDAHSPPAEKTEPPSGQE